MVYVVCVLPLLQMPVTQNAKVQTTEPVVSQAESERLQAQLTDTAAKLQDSERAVMVCSPSLVMSLLMSPYLILFLLPFCLPPPFSSLLPSTHRPILGATR